jgi:hypothetical protein
MRTISREQWWQEYARWIVGEREGPLCVRCAKTVPASSLGVDGWALCDECIAGGETGDPVSWRVNGDWQSSRSA